MTARARRPRRDRSQGRPPRRDGVGAAALVSLLGGLPQGFPPSARAQTCRISVVSFVLGPCLRENTSTSPTSTHAAGGSPRSSPTTAPSRPRPPTPPPRPPRPPPPTTWAPC